MAEDPAGGELAAHNASMAPRVRKGLVVPAGPAPASRPPPSKRSPVPPLPLDDKAIPVVPPPGQALSPEACSARSPPRPSNKKDREPSVEEAASKLSVEMQEVFDLLNSSQTSSIGAFDSSRASEGFFSRIAEKCASAWPGAYGRPSTDAMSMEGRLNASFSGSSSIESLMRLSAGSTSGATVSAAAGSASAGCSDAKPADGDLGRALFLFGCNTERRADAHAERAQKMHAFGRKVRDESGSVAALTSELESLRLPMSGTAPPRTCCGSSGETLPLIERQSRLPLSAKFACRPMLQLCRVVADGQDTGAFEWRVVGVTSDDPSSPETSASPLLILCPARGLSDCEPVLKCMPEPVRELSWADGAATAASPEHAVYVTARTFGLLRIPAVAPLNPDDVTDAPFAGFAHDVELRCGHAVHCGDGCVLIAIGGIGQSLRGRFRGAIFVARSSARDVQLQASAHTSDGAAVAAVAWAPARAAGARLVSLSLDGGLDIWTWREEQLDSVARIAPPRSADPTWSTLRFVGPHVVAVAGGAGNVIHLYDVRDGAGDAADRHLISLRDPAQRQAITDICTIEGEPTLLVVFGPLGFTAWDITAHRWGVQHVLRSYARDCVGTETTSSVVKGSVIKLADGTRARIAAMNSDGVVSMYDVPL